MSQRSIEDFKAVLQGGGVRPTMFEVEMTFPETVVPDPTLATNEGTFLIKAASLPASNVGVINVPFRGRQLKVSGDRVFADWQIQSSMTYPSVSARHSKSGLSVSRTITMLWVPTL